MKNEPNFSFVIVETPESELIFAIQYYTDDGEPDSYAVLGAPSHKLFDFLQAEIKSMRKKFLVPRNTTIH